MQGIRVLLADENYGMLQYLAAYLEGRREIGAVRLESDRGRLMRTVCAMLPDVAVVNASMGDALDGLGELRALMPDSCPALTLILPENCANARETAQRYGAKEWLTKPILPAQLLGKILSAAAGSMLPLYQGRALPENIAGDVTLRICLLFGMSAQLSGCAYLRECARLVRDSGTAFRGRMGDIYQAVAARYATTPANVERSMRYAIQSAWKRGHAEKVNAMLGGEIILPGEVPTCTEFIMTLARLARDMETLAALQN